MASSDSEGDIFEVDTILEKRGRGKNVEYLIRWKGYGEEEDSWEPAKNISGAADVIAAYNKRAESTKTPRRLSRGRSGAGDAATKTEEVFEKSSKKSSTGATTKTVTTTKTYTKTQSKVAMSDTSSPEASPTVTRKSLRSQQFTAITKPSLDNRKTSSSATSRFRSMLQMPGNAINWFQLTYKDLPIIILVTCLLVIASSFYISGK